MVHFVAWSERVRRDASTCALPRLNPNQAVHDCCRITQSHLNDALGSRVIIVLPMFRIS